jgi:hypothetical protein
MIIINQKKKIIEKLKRLKKAGVSGVKLSLEDEGSTFEDLKLMRFLTKLTNLDLNVKIGGCEAKNDIMFCKLLKPNSIVAPMVESEYALKKFLVSVGKKNKLKLLINLETISAFKNIKKIVNSKYFKILDGVVIGRSDLAGSINLTKNEVNSSRILNIIKKGISIVKKKSKKNFLIKMGGSITPKSQNFIKDLYLQKIINRVETRNIELNLNTKIIKNLDQIIPIIFDFELEWLKLKLRFKKKKKYNLLINEYKLRIREIQERIKKNVN